VSLRRRAPDRGRGGLLDDQHPTASSITVFDRASDGTLKGTVATFEIERDGALSLLDSDHDDSPGGGFIGLAGRWALIAVAVGSSPAETVPTTKGSAMIRLYAKVTGVTIILIGVGGLLLGDKSLLGVLNIDLAEDGIHLLTGGLLEDVPGLVELEVAVPRSAPASR